MLGLSFLTPLGSLFVLAAAVPLAALVHAERRARVVRALFGVRGPGRRALLPVVLALLLLPALVAVAAAQPVVVRSHLVSERPDAQAYVLMDTSLSMSAAPGRLKPPRLARAKAIALEVEHALPDVPMGIASWTDRVLPNLLPTVDRTLFERTLAQSVAIDRPPPSDTHHGRATTFDAMAQLLDSNYFSPGVQRRLVVVLTDGEATKISPLLRLVPPEQRGTFLYVHVWNAADRIPGTRYVPDPSSDAALRDLTTITGGRVFEENQVGAVERAARVAMGHARAEPVVAGYARVPLAPWFVLAGLFPLAYLVWRRNL
jgi:hypothetical protein